MKRFIGLLTALILLASVQVVQAQRLGIGVFAGKNIPIAQDDAGSGSQWGIRGVIQAVPMIRFEPFLNFIKNGDYTLPGPPLGGPFDFSGGKVNAMGIEGILGTPMGGPGFGLGLVGGIGRYKYKPDVGEELTNTGYTVGIDLGVGLSAMPVRIGARGTALVITVDGGGSRKHLLVSLGATYSIGK